eukprot:766277-Hanusia_phi.AAC.3
MGRSDAKHFSGRKLLHSLLLLCDSFLPPVSSILLLSPSPPPISLITTNSAINLIILQYIKLKYGIDLGKGKEAEDIKEDNSIDPALGFYKVPPPPLSLSVPIASSSRLLSPPPCPRPVFTSSLFLSSHLLQEEGKWYGWDCKGKMHPADDHPGLEQFVQEQVEDAKKEGSKRKPADEDEDEDEDKDEEGKRNEEEGEEGAEEEEEEEEEDPWGVDEWEEKAKKSWMKADEDRQYPREEHQG